jgi:hypothetical protein
MFKMICSLTIFSILAISNLLTAGVTWTYDIQDIGTLQTESSEAIASNNRGQILGWYNIDGSSTGKHFFVRDRDGSFHELLKNEPSLGLEIKWQYLTGSEKAYGTFNVNNATTALCQWDKQNGFLKLGVLPAKEIMAINDAGQVLIKSIGETENGRSIRRPVIWQNGQVTKLRGLEGDLGIESEESYGLDMNNSGEVVGHSVAYLIYKNDIYKQVHAVKWATTGEITELHNLLPKNETTEAFSINDFGDILVNANGSKERFLIKADGSYIKTSPHQQKLSNGYSFGNAIIFKDPVTPIVGLFDLTKQAQADRESLWASVVKITNVNDRGEVIAQGKTIYGEQHAMLLTPTKKN